MLKNANCIRVQQTPTMIKIRVIFPESKYDYSALEFDLMTSPAALRYKLLAAHRIPATQAESTIGILIILLSF